MKKLLSIVLLSVFFRLLLVATLFMGLAPVLVVRGFKKEIKIAGRQECTNLGS
jgi:hypothetical protein